MDVILLGSVRYIHSHALVPRKHRLLIAVEVAFCQEVLTNGPGDQGTR